MEQEINRTETNGKQKTVDKNISNWKVIVRHRKQKKRKHKENTEKVSRKRNVEKRNLHTKHHKLNAIKRNRYISIWCIELKKLERRTKETNGKHNTVYRT